MFKITLALYKKLYRAYKAKGKITCVRGKDENPDSYFTSNISFTLNSDGKTATVKSKFGKQARYCNELMQYLNNNHPTQLVW